MHAHTVYTRLFFLPRKEPGDEARDKTRTLVGVANHLIEIAYKNGQALLVLSLVLLSFKQLEVHDWQTFTHTIVHV